VAFSSVDKKTREGEQVIRLCNYTDVYERDEIVDDPSYMVATASTDQVRELELRPGDVLITKDSETADDIGIAAWVPSELSGVVCGYHLALIRPNPTLLRSDYLFWALRSQLCRAQFSAAANGITRFALRADAVSDVVIPVPPLDQQAVLSSRLRWRASVARRLTDALTSQVSLLSEHRQALITAAVIGGIGS